MIDIHTHVLPGVDDGSNGIDESIEMLRVAESLGFRAVTLTPHYMSYTNYTSTLSNNKKIMQQLVKAMKQQNLEIQVYLGNEVFYDPDILKILDSDQFIALNKSRYLLVETVRHDASVESFEDFLYRLQLKGYSPVIAHPERYDFIQEDPNVLLDLINKGSFIQMNMLSLTGYYGHGAKETAHIMLENNMAQFMASDAHRVRSYKLMDEALAIAQDILGARQFKRMMSDNPKVALGGNGRIECAPKAYTKRKKHRWSR
ncbi:tyrosine-protein phosphatase [Eubacterium barkeri]|uniref:protein-tyrosine-phosphatase n=1 Tax=Eubacterium barkeri TaxID=1528 RepID=A0A1H3G881_EUBBA|nr:CpsB/CapC family capsule biosynthesis tyrosine phosphatase [Eubacterium barkeri]SDX99553.1 protein-tyrosine phosphatase [Eubacterium barkeri]